MQMKTVFISRTLTGLSNFIENINIPFQVKKAVVKIQYRNTGAETGVSLLRCTLLSTSDNGFIGSFSDSLDFMSVQEFIYDNKINVNGAIKFELFSNLTVPLPISNRGGNIIISINFYSDV